MDRSLIRDVCTLWLAAWCCWSVHVRADPPSSPGEMLEIAELNDIYFIDPDCGWAVGDHGVIWRTRNGGRNWDLADTPATCRFESVHFIDENHGWVVGGWIHPMTQKSTAVVLYTDDGGHRWTRLDQPLLPALKWVWFANQRQGWAAGNASSLYPAGLMRTEDGGRTWNTLPLSDPRSFISASMTSRNQVVTLDRDSLSWFSSGDDLRPAPRPDLGLKKLKAIAADGADAWLVGDGGVVLVSHDGGGMWDAPRGILPDHLGRNFDWQAVAVKGSHCWIAGVPGTCVLHSPDRGASWQMHSTRHRTPISALHFIDENQGWAAGAFGSILATRDGGKSWRIQRQGAIRAGLMGIFGSHEQIPWELFASVAADEGHCAVIQMGTISDGPQSEESTSDERIREAAAAVGAASDRSPWRFPVKSLPSTAPIETIAAKWQAGSGRTPIEQYEEYLVRQIRMWRPDIVVCDPVSSIENKPLFHLVSQLALRACDQASNPSSFSEQVVHGQLEPWTVKKVFSVLPDGQRGAITIDHEKLAVHLGCSLADYAALSRALVSKADQLPPAKTELRVVGGEMAQTSGHREIFSGISLGDVGESRRAPLASVGVNLDSLGRALQKRREAQQWINRAAQQGGGSAIAAQLDRITAGYSPHYAGVILHRLAQDCLARNDNLGCSSIRTALVERYPDHLFAGASLLSLIDFYASAEYRAAFGSSAMPKRDTGEGIVRLPPATLPSDARPDSFPDSEATRPAVFTTESAIHSTIEPVSPEAKVAFEYFDKLKAHHAPLFHGPPTQLQLAAMHRRAANFQESDRIVNVLVNSSIAMRYRSAARAEQWLSHRAGQAPRPVLPCVKTAEKPYLDGLLQESFWRESSPAILKGPGPQPTIADVRFACDSEFLFVGVRCLRSKIANENSSDFARARDTDLSASDRIEIALDIDRDYATHFRFVVDQRGWINDECCQNKAWNPRWHLASTSNAEEWSFEAAIPLAELEPLESEPRQAWGVIVQRRLPDGPIHAWPEAGIDEPNPYGCGYLLFH